MRSQAPGVSGINSSWSMCPQISILFLSSPTGVWWGLPSPLILGKGGGMPEGINHLRWGSLAPNGGRVGYPSHSQTDRARVHVRPCAHTSVHTPPRTHPRASLCASTIVPTCPRGGGAGGGAAARGGAFVPPSVTTNKKEVNKSNCSKCSKGP